MIPDNRATCMDWRNHAAIPEARSLQLRSAFLAELQQNQVVPEADTRPCGLQVLIDRTPSQLVFAARITSAESERVVIGRVSRNEVGSLAAPGAALHIQKELLWQQSERILDAVQIAGSDGRQNSFLILTQDAVSLFREESASWKLQRTWVLANNAKDRRAPRGELALQTNRPGVVKIVFPGKACELNVNEAAPLCSGIAPESWRGQIHLHSQCDSTAWVLRADSTDWSTPDRIVFFDPSLPKPQPPATEVNLPGPVLSISGGDPSLFAITVVFNLTTGNYEVYELTVDCAN